MLGNRKLMQENRIDTASVEVTMQSLEEDGKTAMLIAVDGALMGIVAVADTLKENSAEAVKTLQQMGLEVIMITGDNERIYTRKAREKSSANSVPKA